MVTALHIVAFTVIRFVSIRFPQSYRRLKKIHIKVSALLFTTILIGAGGFGLDFWAGQIGDSVANDATLLRRLFEALLPK